MRKIVSMMCRELARRAKDQLGIKLEIRDSVKSHIVETGTDKKYGARPLRRAVQNLSLIHISYCARSALGLSVITMIFALASWAILAVILSIEEYLGKLNIIRQSSLDMLQMWSMGLMAELLADSTFGTMCFKYSRK